MAGKLKVDLSGIQQFFVERGEKIALGLCVLAAGLLVTMGVLDAASVRTAPNSPKPYALAMKDAAKSLADKVQTYPYNQELDKDPTRKFLQVPWRSDPANPNIRFDKLFDLGDTFSTKRHNPRVKPILAGSDTVAMWYVPGSYFAHDIVKGKQTIVVYKPAPNPNNPMPQPRIRGKKEAEVAEPAIINRPERMVVVNCVFPMREQLLEFQNAFCMQSQAELWASKDLSDLPHFLGLNIWKSEVAAGKPDAWKPLVATTIDPKTGETTGIEVDESIKSLFREALLDEDNLALYSPFLMQGLTMPLPRLAILPNGQYPPLKLAGLEVDENFEGGRGGAMPNIPGMNNKFNPFPGPNGAGAGMQGGMQGGGKDMERDIAFPWQKLKKDLQDKLNDRTFVLDPLLVNFDPEDEKKEAEPLARNENKYDSFYEGNSLYSSKLFWTKYPPPPMPVAPGTKEPKKNAKQLSKPYDALVRFVDPMVEPGKTYKYLVQVRMANPNFGKKEEVAIPALADVKELRSPTVETPTITIPEEYFLFAVDQKPAYRVLHGSDWDTPKEGYKQEHIAVQIHRWVDETGPSRTNDKVIGDWCIAERIYIRRGDPVGRLVNVEMPVWNSDTNRFELGKSAEDAAGPKPPARPPAKGMMAPPPVGGNQGATGTQVQFSPTMPPPVLVDFDGGKRELQVQELPNSAKKRYQDESASDLLILRADGTLIVRNTRTDSETDTPSGKERLQRIETWKAKTDPFRMLNNPIGPGRPGPGIFGNKS